MTLEAAHSRPRVLHAADTTGRAIVATLAQQVLQRDNIQVFDRSFALSLWLNEEKHCQGISILQNNSIDWIRASAGDSGDRRRGTSIFPDHQPKSKYGGWSCDRLA